MKPLAVLAREEIREAGETALDPNTITFITFPVSKSTSWLEPAQPPLPITIRPVATTWWQLMQIQKPVKDHCWPAAAGLVSYTRLHLWNGMEPS